MTRPQHALGLASDRAIVLLALLSGALVLMLLAARLWWLPVHAPINVNEGWNALHAAQAMAGTGLYPAPDELTANNYPPLSFYVVGAVGQVLGDYVIAGRIVAGLAEVAVALAVFATVLSLTRSRAAAWIGVMLFAGFAATMLRRYAVMNDPQWLAVASTSWAMALVVRALQAEHRRRLALVAAAAALTVLGVMTKHNTVAIPLALTAWLWIKDRRSLAVWCGVGGVLCLGALAAFAAAWGQAGLIGIVHESRSYSPLRMLGKSVPDLLALAPGILAFAIVWRLARREPTLPLLLLVMALPLGIVQRAGAGVDINAFFEAVIALSIAVAVACAAEPARVRLVLALSALPILSIAPFAVRDDVAALTGRDAAVRDWGELISWITAIKGPAACDDQAVCYWAGRDAGIDVFATKQRLLKDRGEAARIAIVCRRFAMIELRVNDPSWQDDLLRPLIFAQYRAVLQEQGRALLVPRGEPIDARCKRARP